MIRPLRLLPCLILGACLLLAPAPDVRAQALDNPVGGREGELFAAVYDGDAVRVRMLLAGGAPLEARDSNGYTALHWAAHLGNREIAQQLIDRGAGIDETAMHGYTPLMLAASRGHEPMIALLLSRGARPDARSADGTTALAYAEANGRPGAVEKLRVALGATGARLPAFKPATVPSLGPVKPRTSPKPVASRRPPQLWENELPATEGFVPDLTSASERLAQLSARLDRLGYGSAFPPYRPLARCVGERFVFLPIAGDPHEYPSFVMDRPEPGEAETNLPYELFVGKIATLERVGKYEGDRAVWLKMESDGSIVRGILHPDGYVPELAPVWDLAVARRLYRGRTLWPRDSEIGRATSSSVDGRVHLGAGVAVRVVEVGPGGSALRPVRLTVEPADSRSGPRGTIDLAMSYTNGPTHPDDRAYTTAAQLFWPGDPHRLMGWSAATWAALERGELTPGMTPDMVRASKGRPDWVARVNATETWNFRAARLTLYFRGGRLVGGSTAEQKPGGGAVPPRSTSAPTASAKPDKAPEKSPEKPKDPAPVGY